MHFYGIGYLELLSVPISFFWQLHINIDRIQAQQDMRGLTLINCAFNGGEPAQEFRKQLILEIGEVQKIKFDPMRERLDRNKLHELKTAIRREEKQK
jgi:hypothetical protein